MSAPNPKAGYIDLLLDCVEEYCESCGEPIGTECSVAPYLYEAIKEPAKQKELGEMWDCFQEYVDDVVAELQSKHQYS